MKFFVFIFSCFSIFISSTAAAQATFVCENNEGRVETVRYPANDNKVVVVAYKNDKAVYGHMFDEIMPENPVQNWILTEVSNPKNIPVSYTHLTLPTTPYV